MSFDSLRQYSRKILTTTLHQIHNLQKTRPDYTYNYNGFNCQFVCFVARLVQKDSEYVFSDETGIFRYDLRRMANVSELKVGCYYQCLCKLINIVTALKCEVINLKQMEGNAITIHMIRVMKQAIQNKQKKVNLNNKEQMNQENENNDTMQDIYKKMKIWARQQYSFTLDDILHQFGNQITRDIFESSFAKLEEEGTIGNMGDFYQFID